ncbi:MAG TPA: ATP-binding cassette domain-containing protein [Erysipelotrichaceae bacterium]|nr:ATP-binding cassette domain-containing protein [Erysipelotrichaceae bacterium]HQB32236.1 ATP-binding cassette domain-containing protein [Erysipelotrichaceae bacterium]
MLKIQNLSFQVTNGTREQAEILKDINLDIPAGSFVAITGPNGSGKSTMAKMIMGIEKPTAGRIIFNGKDITDTSIDQRAKEGIGFAFQQPVHFKGMQVIDLLSLAAGHKLGVEEACNYLSQVGLCAINYIFRELDNSLSGGEMKRIEIAMLAARNVQLYIFDEPEAGIDLWSFQNLIQVFKNLLAQTNGIIIVISHQERILEIADRIIVMEDGSIAKDGSSQEVLPHLMFGVDKCQFYGRRLSF